MKSKNPLSFFHSLALITLLIFSVSCSKNSDNTKDDSTSEGWISLFNGTDLDGWKTYGAAKMSSIWIVEDGMIVCDSAGGGEAKPEGGTLITTMDYGNFEFSVDYKIPTKGNSGLIYHIKEDPKYKYAYSTGPEYQLVDDDNYIYELTEQTKTASYYDVYPASPDKKLNPPGQWNTAKIVYNNGHIEHWLNGEKVVDIDENSADYKARFAKSKWAEYPGWNSYKAGAIGLQDHGNRIYFRNVKVREL